MNGIRLRHLAFTGPDIEPAKLEFVDGLNIVYGASNTGKSFASEAVLFMLGAVSKLPKTDEIKAYDAVWLGLMAATRLKKSAVFHSTQTCTSQTPFCFRTQRIHCG